MAEMEADYLIVGAGASGLAFTDALLAQSDARVVIVDRRDRPGGHWLDAYPFVRLHQTSANYGVSSRPLGQDRIDADGFYERATAPEICEYFARVLDDMVATGRVTFLGMHDYRGDAGDGYRVTSLLTGRDTVVRARKLVDATYVESTIPSRHTPSYAVDGARVIPPNDLVNVTDAPSGFTVIGAGKTAMDTCNWLLDNGVDAAEIQWVRPRDSWMFNRALMQPLDLVGSYMQLQAGFIAAAAEAEDGRDFARRLEARDVLLRIDTRVEPELFRGAILSARELESLRTLDRVIRLGKVQRITADRMVLDGGEVAAEPNHLYVDCTAAGVRPTVPRPVFEGDRITVQYVTIGIVPWSAAIIGAVEALKGDDDAVKNALCPPGVFTGSVADALQLVYSGVSGLLARGADPDLAAWNETCRLDPAMGAGSHAHEPDVAEAFTTIGTHMGAALENLARRTAGA
jgi:hypothetical protein